MTMYIVNEPGDSMQPGVFLLTVILALIPPQYFLALMTMYIFNEPGDGMQTGLFLLTEISALMPPQFCLALIPYVSAMNQERNHVK